MKRVCAWCRVVELTGRVDAKTCSKRCRQALARFRSSVSATARSASPLDLGYADPPYLGKSGLYVGHPDYRGEVDHRELLARLVRFDGWALSTDAEGLVALHPLLAGIDHRIAAWVRGPRPGPATGPLSSWEAVVYRPARADLLRDPPVDSLVFTPRPRLTDPERVIGAKPAAFYSWLFALLGAAPQDRFNDLYPGSGGGMRAWDVFTARST